MTQHPVDNAMINGSSTVLFWMDRVMVGTLQGLIPLFQKDQTRVVRVYYPLQVFID